MTCLSWLFGGVVLSLGWSSGGGLDFCHSNAANPLDPPVAGISRLAPRELKYWRRAFDDDSWGSDRYVSTLDSGADLVVAGVIMGRSALANALPEPSRPWNFGAGHLEWERL